MADDRNTFTLPDGTEFYVPELDVGQFEDFALLLGEVELEPSATTYQVLHSLGEKRLIRRALVAVLRTDENKPITDEQASKIPVDMALEVVSDFLSVNKGSLGSILSFIGLGGQDEGDTTLEPTMKANESKSR